MCGGPSGRIKTVIWTYLTKTFIVKVFKMILIECCSRTINYNLPLSKYIHTTCVWSFGPDKAFFIAKIYTLKCVYLILIGESDTLERITTSCLNTYPNSKIHWVYSPIDVGYRDIRHLLNTDKKERVTVTNNQFPRRFLFLFENAVWLIVFQARWTAATPVTP